MATTTTANNQTVVHKSSDGVVSTVDVCKTQVGNAVVPIPYANTAKSADTAQGSRTVTVDGNPIMLKDSILSKSSGDEPGAIGGVSSGVTNGPAKFTNYSFNVKVENRPVCRRLDPVISNKQNTPPAPLMQPNASGDVEEGILPHWFSFSLSFKKPSVLTKRITNPVIATANTLSGTETRVQDDEEYTGTFFEYDQAGEYALELDDPGKDKSPFE